MDLAQAISLKSFSLAYLLCDWKLTDQEADLLLNAASTMEPGYHEHQRLIVHMFQTWKLPEDQLKHCIALTKGVLSTIRDHTTMILSGNGPQFEVGSILLSKSLVDTINNMS